MGAHNTGGRESVAHWGSAVLEALVAHRFTIAKLMRVPQLVGNQRVQVHREHHCDRATLAGVGAAVCAGWELAKRGLQGGAAKGDGFGRLPLNLRDDRACEAFWGLSGQGYVYRARQGASDEDDDDRDEDEAEAVSH